MNDNFCPMRPTCVFVCRIIMTYTHIHKHITLSTYAHKIDIQIGMCVNDHREGFRV
jgi:hypothetical protein